MERSPHFRWRDTVAALAHAAILWRREPARRVYFKQVYFSGLQSLPLVLLVAFAVSGILVGQLRDFGQAPREAIAVLLRITLDELAPLLTAFLVAARSAPAMASELATLQASGEVRLLARLGIPPLQYLVVPRVFGMVSGCLLLSIYFAITAALTGSLFAAPSHALGTLLQVGETLAAGAIIACMLKSLLFGAAIALVACHTGLAARGSYTEVPIAASRAVVRGLACVLLIDLVMVPL